MGGAAYSAFKDPPVFGAVREIGSGELHKKAQVRGHTCLNPSSCSWWARQISERVKIMTLGRGKVKTWGSGNRERNLERARDYRGGVRWKTRGEVKVLVEGSMWWLLKVFCCVLLECFG